MQVVPVKWKRTDNNPNGRVRFQCMRCKHSWSMNNIRTLGGGLHIDESHPEEVKRRRKISPYYNEDVAVNLGPTPGQAQFPGGQCNLIGGTRASARMS